MARYLLLVAALPALVGSILLLLAQAAPTLAVQQATVAFISAAAMLAATRYTPSSTARQRTPWLLLGLAASIYLPLFDDAVASPHRWIVLQSFRLYVAPVVLPFFLLSWHGLREGEKATSALSTGAAVAIALGLLLQPDAAQLTAFAFAAVPLLAYSAKTRTHKLAALVVLIIAAAASWWLPDPLVPVPYVEGVFELAGASSGWALVLAVIATALPVVALVWLAYSAQSLGILGVAIYYSVLYLLAPAQVTPVPLLGFGAGPVLGYFLMASQVSRVKKRNELV